MKPLGGNSVCKPEYASDSAKWTGTKETLMGGFRGIGGIGPSKPASWLAVVVGVGMLLTFVSFFFNPLAGFGAFAIVWVVALVGIIGYHLWNATSAKGVPHTQFNFRAGPDSSAEGSDGLAERLRDLEQLQRDGLITEEEYQQKRAEIMQSRW
jgi:hypothetical protein